MAGQDGPAAAATPGQTPLRRKASVTQRELAAEHYAKNYSTLTWRHASNEQFVDDVTLRMFYAPHTITLLVIGGIFLVYTAFKDHRDAGETAENVKRGLQGICFIFMLVSLVAFPNGPFTRPHPAVWRMVLGVTVLYWMALVFALFQNYSDVRAVLLAYDPSIDAKNLNQLDAEDYAADCSFTYENLASRADIFLLAHFLGWVVKFILFRSLTVCWVSSVTWELTEIIFAPMLPNFYECWWDQILYDVLICNALGILIGYKLGRYLEMKTYTWESVITIKSLRGKTKRALLQFTPASWTRVEWDLFSSRKRYLSVNFVVAGVCISELNSFFLKHIFVVPSSNPLNIYRLALWSLMGAPALRQVYVYVTDPTCKRLGTQAWMAGGVLFTETLVCFKFGWPLWPVPLTLSCIAKWLLMQVGSICLVLYLHKRWTGRWWEKELQEDHADKRETQNRPVPSAPPPATQASEGSSRMTRSRSRSVRPSS